jgi:uncharacterized protein (TIGR03435 family)
MNHWSEHGSRLIVLVISAAMIAGLVSLHGVSAQSETNDWEKKAGGKMAFEVASVKRSDDPQQLYHSNFPLTLGSSDFASVGNLMSVDTRLRILIRFAFKVSDGQMQFLMKGLPNWVDSESFDIQARAPISAPTKDQFRLMTQSLLEDRFKMVVHREKRQIPIYALVLSKPGKTGAQLRPHVDDAGCGAQGKPDAPPSAPEYASWPCGSTLMGGRGSNAPGRVRGGGRAIGLDYLAAFLTGTGFEGTAPDRPIVNQTGLDGMFDFWIEFAPEATGPAGMQPDPSGPSLPEALQDQLGLKLVATTGSVDVIVVDHIEDPSPN